MPSGEAPTAESSTISALLARHWSHRRPVPNGVLAMLTVLFWAVWVYLVLPLISLLLWALGVRLFMQQIAQGGYEGVSASLVAYSSVLLVLVGLLALWITWNVVRYGGRSDRRTAKGPEVTDEEVLQAFRLDDSLLAVLRDGRFVRADLNGTGVVVIAGAPPQAVGPAMAVTSDTGAGPQRERERTRPG